MRSEWRRGRHSGFPVCCVIWFLVRDRSGWVSLVHNRYWYRRWLTRTGADKPIQHQYVRCPLCWLRRRYVEMHLCTLACAGQLGCCQTILSGEAD